MATFTMFFKDYISLVGGQIVTDTRGTVLNRSDLVGLSTYPLFDDGYRVRLNGLIVDRFMNREIGSESASDFRRMLRSKMNEIMPFYNRMYEADQINFDPLRTIDIRTLAEAESKSNIKGTSTAESTGNETGSSESESETQSHNETEADSRSRGVTSETPQTMLSGSEDYASGAADQTGRTTGTSDSTASDNTKTDSTRDTTDRSEAATESDSVDESQSSGRTYGFQGSAADLIIRFREAVSDTDNQVLNALDECFMQIYDNDQTTIPAYFRPRYYRRF